MFELSELDQNRQGIRPEEILCIKAWPGLRVNLQRRTFALKTDWMVRHYLLQDAVYCRDITTGQTYDAFATFALLSGKPEDNPEVIDGFLRYVRTRDASKTAWALHPENHWKEETFRDRADFEWAQGALGIRQMLAVKGVPFQTFGEEDKGTTFQRGKETYRCLDNTTFAMQGIHQRRKPFSLYLLLTDRSEVYHDTPQTRVEFVRFVRQHVAEELQPA
jgi:hypothetical protein